MSKERPNILLVTTDQQRFDTIQALGNERIYTPHLNWLVDNGITYSRCYSDCPVCMPARATIMTGRHAYNNSATANTDPIGPDNYADSLPSRLGGLGYQTKAVGKMHFAPERACYGFDHMELLADYYAMMAEQPQRGKPLSHGIGQNEMTPVISELKPSDTLTHWTVERSIRFLETRDPLRPFFLWSSFSKPHPPFDACREYWELYRDFEMTAPVSGDWSSAWEDVPTGYRYPTTTLNMFQRFSAEQKAAAKRAYYACITQVDYELGVLFARMRELGLLTNTWIIFTSDHGEMMGDHQMGAKSTFFEGSAHVPLIVVPPMPGEEPGYGADRRIQNPVDTRLCCLADIFPTVLSIASAEQIEGHADGLNLLNQMEHGQAQHAQLLGKSGAFYMLLDGDFKYHYTEYEGVELLFNLKDDPMEQRDLSSMPEQRERMERFRRTLAEGMLGQPGWKQGAPTKACTPVAKSQQNTWPGLHSIYDPSEVLH